MSAGSEANQVNIIQQGESSYRKLSNENKYTLK